MLIIEDICWVMMRMVSRSAIPASVESRSLYAQEIPFWTGFNSMQAEKKGSAIVAYGPIIDSTPSDMSTVYTTMIRAKELANELGQKYSIQTFDQNFMLWFSK